MEGGTTYLILAEGIILPGEVVSSGTGAAHSTSCQRQREGRHGQHLAEERGAHGRQTRQHGGLVEKVTRGDGISGLLPQHLMINNQHAAVGCGGVFELQLGLLCSPVRRDHHIELLLLLDILLAIAVIIILTFLIFIFVVSVVVVVVVVVDVLTDKDLVVAVLLLLLLLVNVAARRGIFPSEGVRRRRRRTGGEGGEEGGRGKHCSSTHNKGKMQ